MDYDVKTWRSSGIYAIVNLVTGQRYIGQTSRFLYRWTKHKLLLRCGEHPNQALQQDWIFYTESAFDFCILEIADISGLVEIEREYIKAASNLYNRARRPENR